MWMDKLMQNWSSPHGAKLSDNLVDLVQVSTGLEVTQSYTSESEQTCANQNRFWQVFLRAKFH